VRIAVVTLFPEMFEPLLSSGVTGRAAKRGLLEVAVVNPRSHAFDVHRTVDDRPYGGGPGMVMMVEPMLAAITEARDKMCEPETVTHDGGSPDGIRKQPKVVYLSPQGKKFDQSLARSTAADGSLVLVAGRYEGLDERIMELVVDEEWSIGDFVLSGGEIAAMAVIDAVARLLPGALGHAQSAEQDSFSEGLLDCPHYSRPEDFRGLRVPAVLLSGNHALIHRWRRKQALGRTYLRRADLLDEQELSQEDRALLAEFLAERGSV
jgi:tRNA (guanine37-N1)-methyltransferase